MEGVACDFSITGMRVRLPRAVQNDVEVAISLYLPREDLGQYQDQAPIEVKGKIAWQNQTDNNYLCGIEFVDLSSRQRESIKACFEFYRKNAEFCLL